MDREEAQQQSFVRQRDTLGTPTSTKAVLQALRALQAKISRLERERVAALNTATELRLKLELSEAKAAEDIAMARSERAALESRMDAQKDERDAARERLIVEQTATIDKMEKENERLEKGNERLEKEVQCALCEKRNVNEERSLFEEKIARLESKIDQLELRNESLEAMSQTFLNKRTTTRPAVVKDPRRRRLQTNEVARDALPPPPPTRSTLPLKKEKRVVKVPTAKAEVPVKKKKVVKKKPKVDNGFRLALAGAIRAADDPSHVKDLTALLHRINEPRVPLKTNNSNNNTEKKPLLF